MLRIALTIVAAGALGMWAHERHGVRASELARTLLRTMLFGMVPVIAFFNIATLRITAEVGLGIVLGWAALALCGLAAWVAATRALRLSRPGTGSLMNSALQGNTGYLGLPLCAAFLGTDRLGEAVAYDSLVQSPVLLLGVFGVGAWFGTRAGDRPVDRLRAFVLRNPPLVGVLLGLVANRLAPWLAPDALVDLSRVLVFALLPLGFFAVGVALAEERDEGAMRFPPPLTRAVACGVGLRLVLAPALLLLVALPWVDIPEPYLLLAAMPSGINGLVVSHAYGLDIGLTAGVIAWSTSIVVAVALVGGAIT